MDFGQDKDTDGEQGRSGQTNIHFANFAPAASPQVFRLAQERVDEWLVI